VSSPAIVKALWGEHHHNEGCAVFQGQARALICTTVESVHPEPNSRMDWSIGEARHEDWATFVFQEGLEAKVIEQLPSRGKGTCIPAYYRHTVSAGIGTPATTEQLYA
jgi:hypothetical protein